MSATAPGEEYQPVRYSSLRKPKLPGFSFLTTFQVIFLSVAVFASLMVMMLWDIIPAVILTVLWLIAFTPWVLGSLLGANPYALVSDRLAFARTKATGETQLVQGLVGITPDGRTRLPGLLAASELFECRDAFGMPFGMIVTSNPRTATVVIECAPPGVSGVDMATVDDAAAQWGDWLAALSREPELLGAQVVIESAPDTGNRLRAAAMAGVREDSPELSRAVLEEVVDAAPTAAAQITSRVALTFSGRAEGKKKAATPEAMAEDIGTRLPALVDALRATGAGSACRPMSSQDITDAVRTAFDPAAASDVERLRAEGQGTGLDWEDAGPVHQEVHYDRLVHDGATSVSWTMSKAPRGTFTTLSLARLLAPAPKVARKRVALLYRPQTLAMSAMLADTRLRQASFEARQSTKVRSLRREQEMKAAELNAEAEAAGAPFVKVGLAVTATVLDPAELRTAKRTVQDLGAAARITLRPAAGVQDSMFTATLPLGLVLHEHVSLPAFVREGL